MTQLTNPLQPNKGLKPMKRIFIVTVVATIVAAGSAHAAECRATKGVLDSAASLSANTAAGGHVSIHVVGQKTESGKSEFLSEADFRKAFTAWQSYTPPPSLVPKTCGGGSTGLMDCVPATGLAITKGSVCNTVDAAGTCTSTKSITPAKVAFRYAKNGKGIWILNTSYPSVNSDCQ
jgi:hypothetical protein